MSITRRHALAAAAATAMLALSGMANAAEMVRIGLPTKTYWPTTIAETAVRQKLFEKEGITAELTIYRGGAETFEAMAAGAADVILDASSLVSAGRKKGVMSKVVANAAMGYYGWQLMVLSKSPLEVKDLNSKKVAITSAGSGSDMLAPSCPTCSPAMSTRRWFIRRSASRSPNPAKPAPSSTSPRKFPPTSPPAGSCSTNMRRKSRKPCRRRSTHSTAR
jgi:hypothetical protein